VSKGTKGDVSSGTASGDSQGGLHGIKRSTSPRNQARTDPSVHLGQPQPATLWYSVSISRVYREGDAWKDTTSFGRDDLPLVSKAAEIAYAWIWNENSEKGEPRYADSQRQ